MTFDKTVLITPSGLLVHVLTRKTKRKELPNETYICDVCGDKDCVCRKENGDG
jgi:hypothetical protein